MTLVRRCYGTHQDLLYCDECETCCEVDARRILPLSKVHHVCEPPTWELPDLMPLAKGIRR